MKKFSALRAGGGGGYKYLVWSRGQGGGTISGGGSLSGGGAISGGGGVTFNLHCVLCYQTTLGVHSPFRNASQPQFRGLVLLYGHLHNYSVVLCLINKGVELSVIVSSLLDFSQGFARIFRSLGYGFCLVVPTALLPKVCKCILMVPIGVLEKNDKN